MISKSSLQDTDKIFLLEFIINVLILINVCVLRKQLKVPNNNSNIQVQLKYTVVDF